MEGVFGSQCRSSVQITRGQRCCLAQGDKMDTLFLYIFVVKKQTYYRWRKEYGGLHTFIRLNV